LEHAFAVPTALKPVLDTFDESHGRLTRRRVFVHPAPTELNMLEEWPGVQSIMAVESIRMAKPDGGVRAEKRFFLSSLPVEDERQIAAIRQHWSIENRLHWVLDVTFAGRYVPSPRTSCSSQSRSSAEKSPSICYTTVRPQAVSEVDENRPRGMMPLWLNCSSESHA
jgi:hypothetical protein